MYGDRPVESGMIARRLLPLDPDRHTFFTAELEHLAGQVETRRRELIAALPESIELVEPRFDPAVLVLDALTEAAECLRAAKQHATGTERTIKDRDDERELDEEALSRRFEGED